MDEKSQEEQIQRLQNLAAELQETLRNLQKLPEASPPQNPVPSPAPFPGKFIAGAKKKGFLLLKKAGTRRNMRAFVVAAVAGLLLFAFLRHRSSLTGLTADYFVGMNFDHAYKSRLDKSIDFNWGYLSPYRLWANDYFSARWTGFLRAPVDGVYTLVIINDDGARIWLGKKLVINDWTVHAPVTNSAKVSLKKGWYPIRIEYFDLVNTAVCQVRWELPNQPKLIPIEPQYLCPSIEKLPDNAVVLSLEEAG